MKEYVKQKIIECRDKTPEEKKQVARELAVDLFDRGYTSHEVADMMLGIMKELVGSMK